MTLLDIAGYLATATCLGWIGVLALAASRALRAPNFDELAIAPLEVWPRVSIIVPACNEAEVIEPAARSLLALDYPELEIVLIDDRSTDATGEIIDRLAGDDERVRAMHVTELPAGWLGKVHAMQRGTEAAGGDWLLYTDADVRYAPDMIRRVIAMAERGAFDHVSLVPDMETRSFVQEVCTQTFATGLMLAVPMHRVPEPDEEAVFGVGAFNLVRRSVLDRSEGLEWLRLEIADDMALGLLMKRHGARAWAGIAPKSLKLEWYASARAMVRGGEKNMFPAIGWFSWLRVVALLTAAIWFTTVPIVGLFLPGMSPWAALTTLAALAAYGLIVRGKAARANPLAVMFLPLGILILSYSLLQSALSFRRNGGAVWRGTTYPTQELRQHQRVRF